MSLLELKAVDALRDELVAGDAADMEVEKWESENLGKSALHRLSRVGRDAIQYHEANTVTEEGQEEKIASTESREQKDFYFHQTGKQLLEMQLFEEEEDKEAALMQKRSARAGKLLKKSVKVSDMEEGDSDLAIDQDWDTSNWKDEMIEAGMDYLFYVFVDPKYESNDTKKELAVTMIDRLLGRHFIAEKYFNNKLESIVSRAISRFVKNGKSAAQTSLLYILHIGRAKFMKELSNFNFAGRSFEMLTIEARLAAMLIQHTFRTYKGRKNFKGRNVNPITLTFGSDFVMRTLRENSIKARGKQLRELWDSLHTTQTSIERNTPSGFTGPCHIEPKFDILILEMALSLVSNEAKDRAQANREDLISHNGSILLANFISFPLSQFAWTSLKIVSHCSKVPSSLQSMLESGIINACLRYINYLKEMGKLKWIIDGKDNLPDRRNMSKAAYEASQVAKHSFFDCILIIARLAIHAAGTFRARGGYDKVVPRKIDVEEIDYGRNLILFTKNFNGDAVRTILGRKQTINTLTTLLLECKHLFGMRTLLLCMYSICCSEGHGPVMFSFCADAGRLMTRILELIDEEDLTVSTLALCIFIQLATIQGGRDTMLVTYIAKALFPYTKAPSNFNKKSYNRAILINCSILRQYEWRSYDPEIAPEMFSDPKFVRSSIYLDLLKSIKCPTLEEADDFTIADLTVLPFNEECAAEFSKTAESIGAQDICNFLVHPGETSYVDHLPWDEACAGCIIIDALCRHQGTASNAFSPALVYYLGRCLFIMRWMFSGAAMSNRQLLMIFQGVKSASNALRQLSLGIEGNEEKELFLTQSLPDLIDPARFFIGNLSMEQTELDPAVLNLQRDASLNMVSFVKYYARFSIKMAKDVQVPLTAMEPIGLEILVVIKRINKIFSNNNDLLVQVLESCCAVLEEVSGSEVGAAAVSAKWGSGDALKEHLPPPLSGVGELGIEEENYIIGLKRMSPSLFRLLANLGLTDRGLADCLSDGFLRRALDKFSILYPVIDSFISCDSDSIDVVKPVPTSNYTEDQKYKMLEASGCLILIARCVNFTSYMYGASNDLILQHYYDIIHRLRNVVNNVGTIEWNNYMDASIQVLCKISSDNVKLLTLFEEIDVVTLVYSILKNMTIVPQQVIKWTLEIVVNLGSSLRTTYLGESLPMLREEVSRVSSIYPELLEDVRSASWSVMRFILDVEKQANGGKAKEDENQFADAAEWKGTTFSTLNDSVLNRKLKLMLSEAKLDPKDLESMESSRKGSITTTTSEKGQRDKLPFKIKVENSVPDKIILDRGNVLKPSDLVLSGSVDESSLYCGPSNCGSLRLPDSPENHGTYSEFSVHDMHSHVAQLPSMQDNKLELTNLSVREPKLREMMRKSKTAKGFVEKKRSTKDTKGKNIGMPISPIKKRSPVPGTKSKFIEQKQKAVPKPLVIDTSEIPEFMKTRPYQDLDPNSLMII